jgi:uncharacterized protein YecE (DUF72 family)
MTKTNRNNKPKFSDNYNKEALKDLLLKLKELFDSKEGGFVFIYNNEKGRLTDMYQGVCAECVCQIVATGVLDAEKNGLLSKRGCKR